MKIKHKSKFNLLENIKLVKGFIYSFSFLVSGSILLLSYFMVNSYQTKLSNTLLIDSSSGKVLTSKVVPIEEVFEIEAKDHLKTFIERFFAYDQFTYEAHIEKALKLGDQSVKEAYDKLKNKELFFSQIVENALISSISWEEPLEDIQIEIQNAKGWPFQIKALYHIQDSEKLKTFTLKVKGILKKTPRDPSKNPHGLLICDFAFEKTPHTL